VLGGLGLQIFRICLRLDRLAGEVQLYFIADLRNLAAQAEVGALQSGGRVEADCWQTTSGVGADFHDGDFERDGPRHAVESELADDLESVHGHALFDLRRT
jgi:hypothetical protein